MRYDDPIGKGQYSKPKFINHSARANLRRGVGGSSAWHGIGRGMSATMEPRRKAPPLRCCLCCPANLNMTIHSRTQACLLWSDFWRGRPPAMRHNQVTPRAEGEFL